MNRRQFIDRVKRFAVLLPVVMAGAAPIAGAHEMEDIFVTIHITVYKDGVIEVDTEHGQPEE